MEKTNVVFNYAERLGAQLKAYRRMGLNYEYVAMKDLIDEKHLEKDSGDLSNLRFEEYVELNTAARLFSLVGITPGKLTRENINFLEGVPSEYVTLSDKEKSKPENFSLYEIAGISEEDYDLGRVYYGKNKEISMQVIFSKKTGRYIPLLGCRITSKYGIKELVDSNDQYSYDPKHYECISEFLDTLYSGYESCDDYINSRDYKNIPSELSEDEADDEWGDTDEDWVVDLEEEEWEADSDEDDDAGCFANDEEGEWVVDPDEEEEEWEADSDEDNDAGCFADDEEEEWDLNLDEDEDDETDSADDDEDNEDDPSFGYLDSLLMPLGIKYGKDAFIITKPVLYNTVDMMNIKIVSVTGLDGKNKITPDNFVYNGIEGFRGLIPYIGIGDRMYVLDSDLGVRIHTTVVSRHESEMINRNELKHIVRTRDTIYTFIEYKNKTVKCNEVSA